MNRYPSAMIIIHWVSVLLVITAYVTSGDPTRGHSSMDFLIGQIHVLSGALLFILVFGRLLARITLPLPQIITHTPLFTVAAKVGHGMLYIFMLLTPIAGWCKLSSKVTYFNAIVFELPLLTSPGQFLHQLGNYHQTIGNVFITLVGLHAAAALLHHYYFKDGTLKKMLPR
ncbi:cytochrome b/b6 domain-containing protein [Aeromonas hydrophila]|uniref:cytochrome b n=1 Tax=Aeromonas hydrophila TaxID=644 RepID=UPI00191D2B46|nr:cytochrome b/b6 domain-containing protein [Aeromonas hydrophila]MBL0432411.1 cytochrome b/b6 domain-containing protein [Aeromonas hydrophila]MBL0468382.1 cytochrome b/b6 domain-containing protein [Aeromonas hydrophila]